MVCEFYESHSLQKTRKIVGFVCHHVKPGVAVAGKSERWLRQQCIEVCSWNREKKTSKTREVVILISSTYFVEVPQCSCTSEFLYIRGTLPRCLAFMVWMLRRSDQFLIFSLTLCVVSRESFCGPPSIMKKSRSVPARLDDKKGPSRACFSRTTIRIIVLLVLW